jgi:guanylate kinase
LSTLFHFREEEKKNILSLTEGNNIVIISGPAGVGKSRIAIE